MSEQINWPTEEESKANMALMVENPEEYEKLYGRCGLGARENMLACCRKGLFGGDAEKMQRWFDYCDKQNIKKRIEEEWRRKYETKNTTRNIYNTK